MDQQEGKHEVVLGVKLSEPLRYKDQEDGKQEVVRDTPTASTTRPQEVVLTDVHIPFVSLVALMVKVAIASIPAAIIVLVLGFFASALFMGLISK